MGSRAWIFIVVIGIVGLASFGLLTKFALDGNKSLQKIASFKISVLEQFGPKGISAVSLRKVRGQSKAILRLTADPERILASLTIHDEIAEYFFRTFSTTVQVLELQYLPPPRWGCQSSSPFLKKKITGALVEARLSLRQSEERVAEWLQREMGLELLDVELRGDRVLCQVGWREEMKRVTPGPEAAGQVAKALSSFVRLPRGLKTVVRFLNADDSAALKPGDGEPSISGASPPGTSGSSNVAHAEELPKASAEPEVLGEWSFDFFGRQIPLRRGADARGAPDSPAAAR